VDSPPETSISPTKTWNREYPVLFFNFAYTVFSYDLSNCAVLAIGKDSVELLKYLGIGFKCRRGLFVA
jgi:hypothetical protein